MASERDVERKMRAALEDPIRRAQVLEMHTAMQKAGTAPVQKLLHKLAVFSGCEAIAQSIFASMDAEHGGYIEPKGGVDYSIKIDLCPADYSVSAALDALLLGLDNAQTKRICTVEIPMLIYAARAIYRLQLEKNRALFDAFDAKTRYDTGLHVDNATTTLYLEGASSVNFGYRLGIVIVPILKPGAASDTRPAPDQTPP